jgi:hypothetical protein
VSAKYRLGWYVTNINSGIKGKIVDVIKTPRGFEYTILVSGGNRLTFTEASLIKLGNQVK